MNDLISILQGVAINAGVEPPRGLSANDPNQVTMVQFINEAGREIARRVDWAVLRESTDVTGTGLATDHDLPADYDRLPIGLAVTSGGWPVRGGVTSDEWASLPSTMGRPKYFYLAGQSISFHPFLPLNETARILYQSKNWTSTGTDALAQEPDRPLVPAELVERGAIWRWRRHVGKDFQDHLAEFEAMLSDMARNDGGVRQP